MKYKYSQDEAKERCRIKAQLRMRGIKYDMEEPTLSLISKLGCPICNREINKED